MPPRDEKMHPRDGLSLVASLVPWRVLVLRGVTEGDVVRRRDCISQFPVFVRCFRASLRSRRRKVSSLQLKPPWEGSAPEAVGSAMISALRHHRVNTGYRTDRLPRNSLYTRSTPMHHACQPCAAQHSLIHS